MVHINFEEEQRVNQIEAERWKEMIQKQEDEMHKRQRIKLREEIKDIFQFARSIGGTNPTDVAVSDISDYIRKKMNRVQKAFTRMTRGRDILFPGWHIRSFRLTNLAVTA